MIHEEAQTDQSTAAAKPAGPTRTLGSQRRLPLATIFSLPKPFGGATDLIQRNAIKSWAQLFPVIDVILLGNEPGIAETAQELGVRHVAEVKFNSHGTPLINSAFESVRQQTNSPFLAYCNCDVILSKAFSDLVEQLAENEQFKQFVAIGKRTDLEVENEINFRDPRQVDWLSDDCSKRGVTSSAVCKEYFLFNRDLYQNLPAFAVGRGNWDNWMIHSAKASRVPVIDVSSEVTAIHQAHDYAHTGSGRFACYVSGDEAKENMRLAGGRHLISGSTPTHRLVGSEIKKEPPMVINPAFWADVPRFVRLMFNLVKG